MNSIFQRTSVRNFEDRQVEPEKVELLLKAAMAAPSACNQQPWEFYLVNDSKLLKELSECTPYSGPVGNAPMAIVPCISKRYLKHKSYGNIDLSAATENILLEAQELGLGAVWIGIAPQKDRMKAVGEILNMDPELEAFAIVPVGYPITDHTQQDRFQKDRIHYLY